MIKKKATRITKFKNTKFYFNDCPICQAMKKAEDEERNLNINELHEVFKEAKRQGAVMGGTIFKKEEKSN